MFEKAGLATWLINIISSRLVAVILRSKVMVSSTSNTHLRRARDRHLIPRRVNPRATIKCQRRCSPGSSSSTRHIDRISPTMRPRLVQRKITSQYFSRRSLVDFVDY